MEVCGGESEGDGPAMGPAAKQRAWVGGIGIKHLACEGGVVVHNMADADDVLALMEPG